jgi:hypothetical protein
MVLGMSRPWKHPKTGVYWFRKAVPEAMRQLVGLVEVAALGDLQSNLSRKRK